MIIFRYIQHFNTLHVFIFFSFILFMMQVNSGKAQEQNLQWKKEKTFLLTMEEAVERSLERNPSLRAAEENRAASRWGVRKAYSNYFPRVNISQSYLQQDKKTIRQANFAIEGVKQMPGFEDVDIPPFMYLHTYGTSFSLTQTIYDGGNLSSQLKIAKANAGLSEYMESDTRAEIIYQVKSTYLQSLKASELIKIRRQSLELTKQNLETARRKQIQGLQDERGGKFI